MPAGFDFGNSPFELSNAEVAGRMIVQSTRAGTVGVAAATKASQIFLGSFAVAQATIAAVASTAPEIVSVVAMGSAATWRTDEDEQCALYLRNLLEGREPDGESVRKLVLAGSESQKFGDPALPHFHGEDRDLALDIDRFLFAMPERREDGLLTAYRQDS